MNLEKDREVLFYTFKRMAEAYIARYKKRLSKQRKTARRRIERNKSRKMPAAMKKAIILRYLQRKRGKSSATAAHFNALAKQKRFWRKKRISRPAKMDGRKLPARGRALDIPDLGRVNKSRVNPRMKYWAQQERDREADRKELERMNAVLSHVEDVQDAQKATE